MESKNGTYLNETLLGEDKESSKPRPLHHGDTLTVGSTILSLHIHTGLETCMGCDPALCGVEGGGDRSQISAPACLALDVQRRKELNRIKKRFGLRVKDIIWRTNSQASDWLHGQSHFAEEEGWQ